MSLAIDWLRLSRAEDPLRYMNDVFQYAHARLGQREDAEDVAIEVVQALPNPCRRRDLRVYMIGMARRKVADQLRRRRSVQAMDADKILQFEGGAINAVLVTAALTELPDDQRELLIMKYVIGLTCSEIGSLLGKKAVAIDSALQRARAAFASQWRAQGNEVAL